MLSRSPLTETVDSSFHRFTQTLCHVTLTTLVMKRKRSYYYVFTGSANNILSENMAIMSISGPHASSRTTIRSHTACSFGSFNKYLGSKENGQLSEHQMPLVFVCY